MLKTKYMITYMRCKYRIIENLIPKNPAAKPRKSLSNTSIEQIAHT